MSKLAETLTLVHPTAEGQVGPLLHEVGHLHRRYMRRHLKAFGVTMAEARAIMYLGANEGVSQTVLARLLDIRPITLTRLLDKLEADDFIARQRNPDDRRAHLLRLKPRGRTVIRGVETLVLKLGVEIAQSMPAAELEEVVRSLGRLHQVLKRLR